MKERTQIHCHACNRYLTVELDMALDGDHVCECPCGHKHYRTVKAGKVTGTRWASQDNTPATDKLSQAQTFKGKPGDAPPPPVQPAQTPTFTMTIVFTSFTNSSGGNTVQAVDHDTTTGRVILKDAWAGTVWTFSGTSTS